MTSKKCKKPTLKNLLLDPYAVHLPLINAKESERLDSLLRSLPTVKLPRPKVPWALLRKVPRNDRKTFRRDFQDEEMQIDVVPDDNNQELRKCLCFGINESTKLLENGSAGAVLVSSDVNPQFMIKHLSNLCVLHRVPFLRVPDLKATLRKTTGIAAAAVALKPHKKLGKLLEEIERISARYPAVDHALLSVQKESFEDEVIEIDDEEEVRDYHLVRSGAERVFVPEVSKAEVKGFLELGGQGEKRVKIAIARPVGYRGLKVKRMKNNNKRKRKGKKDN